jgi:hypothetical protein
MRAAVIRAIDEDPGRAAFRHAIQIVTQLPEEADDAGHPDFARDRVLGFLTDPKRRKMKLNVVAITNQSGG